MKILLSPSKTMSNFSPFKAKTMPLFLDKSQKVENNLFQALKETTLKNFYNVSEKKEKEILTLLENSSLREVSPALTSFTGLVFKYLDPLTLDEKSLEFLEDRLLIFSGLYGILRPFDGIKPYRLDYESPLKIDGISLESFWNATISAYLNQASDFIINLASKEYYKLLLNRLNIPVYTFEFKVAQDGKLKTKATLSKMARGSMLRLIASQQITTLEEIKKLKPQGFYYDESKSSGTTLLYIK